MPNRIVVLIVILFGAVSARAETAQPTSWKFSFAPGAGGDRFIQINADTQYSDDLGHGFEPGFAPGGDTPFFFSVKAPEGSYRVKLILGDAQHESTTTVKSELRRLMLEQIRTGNGEFVTRTITVNTRTPRIAGADNQQVRLKPRESQKTPGGEWAAWDDKLTLEFSGARPSVRSIEIDKADDLPVVYLCGDSTVCDQPSEPFNSWGQMLPRWIKPDVVIANHAESGETAAAFFGEKRMDKIMTTLKAGDYVFVQFGHNDMKPASNVPVDRYQQLLERFITNAKEKGATPVLITPVSRKSFGEGGKITNSFGEYPDTVRKVAKEQNVALIDLQNLSAAVYEAIGRDKIQPAFANANESTHHSDWGSYEIAKCIVQGIIDARLPLAKHVVEEWKPFDPSHPDPLESFKLPPDPRPARVQTPAGS